MIYPKAIEAIKLIKYERKMLHYCYDKLKKEWDNADIGKRNILLENFLLHARVLRDFFTSDPIKDDISATHFFENRSAFRRP